jgi:hypothetical protein
LVAKPTANFKAVEQLHPRDDRLYLDSFLPTPEVFLNAAWWQKCPAQYILPSHPQMKPKENYDP